MDNQQRSLNKYRLNNFRERVIYIPKKRKELSDFMKKYYDVMDNINIKERWKPINIGDEPIYEVSNLGRVRRIATKYVINPFHSYRKFPDNSFDYNRPTYLRVQLYYYENGKRYKRHFEISRLVAAHFIPVPKKYINAGYTMDTLQVNHINGGYYIYDNTVRNLEWCLPEENIDKAFETGLRHPKFGENHHSTYLSTNDVIKICRCIEDGLKCSEAYEELQLDTELSYRVFKYNFYNIKYKLSWKWISQNFNF